MAYYSPRDVELFRMFNIEVGPTKADLWHFIPVNNGGSVIIDREAKENLTNKKGGEKILGMTVDERVKQLSILYSLLEPTGESPFPLS